MPSNHLILCHPLLLLPWIFSRIRSFLMGRLFISGGQNIGISASASILSMNNQGWFPLVLTCLISLESKGLSRVFSTTTDWKHQFFGVQPFLWSNSHIHTWLLGKPQLCLDGPLLAKWHFCFLMCYVYHNFPSKEQVSFNFMASVTVWTDFHKIYHCFHFYLPWSDGTRCHNLNQRIKLTQLLFYFLFSFP